MKNIPSKDSPAFGIITPTPYLEQYASQSHFHLVLAHLVDTDTSYAEFYARMSERGDFIICDNGAFELGESYDPDKLIELGKKCKADAIVLPDYPFQHYEKTIQAALQLGPLVHDAGFKTMFVPQSETNKIEDWISSYGWAAGNPLIDIIGMSILGIPNALPHIPASYARVVMTQLLQDRRVFDYDKYHHYLGLNAGPALEIPPLIEMQALDSIDSSGPVWTGICGQEYNRSCDSYQITRKINKHVDFNYPLTNNKQVLSSIQHNIDLTLELLEKH